MRQTPPAARAEPGQQVRPADGAMDTVEHAGHCTQSLPVR